MMDCPAPRASTAAPRGVKRRAEDDPRDEQRLAKRFDLLNLGMRDYLAPLKRLDDLLIATILRSQ